MKKIVLFILLMLPVAVFCQSKMRVSNYTDSVLQRIDSMLVMGYALVDHIETDLSIKNRYKLYPTQNIYNFLELDTKTGIIKQVQWNLDSDKEGTVYINRKDLDFGMGEGSGTFELYSTQNIYQFILLNKVTGNMWHVQWGFEDEKLFSYAKEKLVEIAAKEEPFNFSVLTVDTHVPDGYLCELCPSDYSNQYANVWVCASRQISEFVSWIQEQDFYDNTMVYICGDHLSMNKTFYGAQTEDEYLGQNRRKVYNAFLNTVITPGEEEEHNRRFTTMDMFPTLLAGLGADIEGERLGLGTNLFSGEKTLAERLGYETLFAELQKKSPFYEEALLFGTSAREMSK